MKRLKKIFKIDALNRLARYKLNEYTTEYGAIIFDKSRGGKISNSFLYHVGIEEYGHIDFYIDKDFRLLNSIWFVGLKSQILLQTDEIIFPENDDFEIPFFNTSIWEGDEVDLWQKVYCQNPIEVYHNGIDFVHITFGVNHKIIPLSKEIQFQYDQEKCLTGILLKGSEVSKLIQLLKT